MDVVKIAQALSDPLRFSILKRIAQKDNEGCCGFSQKDTEPAGVCVCHLVDGLGLGQSKVSYHIKELKDAGLILEETRGKWNYYYLQEDVLRAYFEAVSAELNL